MAANGTVAVLRRGGFHAPRETPPNLPVQAFHTAGTRMAVATDSNPRSTPSLFLRLAMYIACALLGLAMPEA